MRLAAAPVDARANVEWLLVRAETKREGALRAAEQLADLSGRYPELLTESGTPVADLALLLALRNPGGTRVPEPVVRRLESRVLEHPSFLTSALVEEASERAAGQAWAAVLEARWRANERALGLLRGLPLDRIQPGALSLTAGDETWLAFVAALAPEAPAGESGPSARHVTLVPAALLEGLFGSALEAGADQVPAYAAARLRLADGEWQAPGPPPAGDGPIELGSADGRLELPLIAPSDAAPVLSVALRLASPQAWPSTASPAGPVRLNAPPAVYPFTVSLILADPDALYASYRRRVWLAMGLVLAATAAALAGLASTWQAFQRQRRLTEMKSNFVSSVSHELRAPIAAVRLMSESLERGVIEGPERQREYMRVIGQECRRLSSLVENVLDFSRIDQGRTKYTFEPVDVAALAAETVELMHPVAAERHVDLAWAPGAGPGGIELPRVDRQALRQALVNLIDNAVKHSPTGAEVVVGIEPGDEAGSRSGARGAAILRLFVEDRGPGIPADEHERIFEPFYRRGSELRRETPGIGIGLSIVKHVAEAHGGRVRVASSPGAGSRFTIELPCTPGPQP